MIDPWFPRTYALTDSITLKMLEFGDEDWQIFSAKEEAFVLFANRELFEFWNNQGLKLEFSRVEFAQETFYYYLSKAEYHLRPVAKSLTFINYAEAISFATAISKTRKLGVTASLGNGIFVEQLSLILPVPQGTSNSVDDKTLLGSWLSGGTEVSVDNDKRMKQLVANITNEELESILIAAGLEKNIKEKQAVTARTKKSEENSSAKKPEEKKVFSLPGRTELETFFREQVIDIIENPQYYSPMGIDFPSAFILQGPPGCGKTYAVQKLVEYLDWPCFYIDSGSIGSSFIHETAMKISAVFDQAIDAAPAIIVIDEMEAFLSSRTSSFSQNHHIEEVGEFLRRIPEAKEKKVLVVAMTNMIGHIDLAIRRKGRFDNIIELGMPSSIEIKMVMDKFLENIPHDVAIDTAKLSDELKGHSMADVNFVMREAARLTAKHHETEISQARFDELIQNMKKAEKDNKKRSEGNIGFRPSRN